MTSQVLKLPASSTLESTETPTLADELRAVGVEPYDEAAVEAYKAEKVQEHSRIFFRKPKLSRPMLGLAAIIWMAATALLLFNPVDQAYRPVGAAYLMGLAMIGLIADQWRKTRHNADTASKTMLIMTGFSLAVGLAMMSAATGHTEATLGLISAAALCMFIGAPTWLINNFRRPNASWQLAYMEHHAEEIPHEVLELGASITEQIPETELYVDEMRREDRALLDPFLVISRNSELCWVKGWDDNGVFDL